MKWGDSWLEGKDLSSLRLLGTVGEPINPEAWMWYHEKKWSDKLPDCRYLVADGNGWAYADSYTGATPTKPGCATLPFFGIEPAVLDEAGADVPAGILAIKQPWPGMMRGIYGDPDRYRQTYWCKWEGVIISRVMARAVMRMATTGF